jgi:hypothetical protein
VLGDKEPIFMNDAAPIFALDGAGPAANASFLESGRGVIRTDRMVDSLARVLEESQKFRLAPFRILVRFPTGIPAIPSRKSAFPSS